MRRIFTFLLSLFFVLFLNAQDTITVMQYNLTYYGLYNDYCTESNNNVAQKTEYIKTIVSYVKPDILGVNEITAEDASYHDYLLNNVFLLNGFDNYKHSQVMGSYITTQVFYNASKLVEKKVYVVSAYPRDIYIHRFYFRTAGLEQGDTVFLNVIEAHLKAGNGTQEAQDRADAVSNLMQFINSHGQDNYLFMGDFNLYTSSEQAYQYAVNPTSGIRFYDPGPAGDWHDNASYAMYHTQSTNYSSNGCLASGGLDDRFDFMLYTQPLRDGTMGVKALSETFKVIGQDGQHFNDGVDYQGNNSVPSDVLTALKNNSDHLPIMMKLYLDAQPAYTAVNDVAASQGFRIINTAVRDEIRLRIDYNELLWARRVDYKVYDMAGRERMAGSFAVDGNHLEYTLPGFSSLPAGLYVIKFQWEGKVYNAKFVRL